MKRIMIVVLVAASALFAQAGETWNVGESVYQISTIDLEPNVDAQYLNQMKRTWTNNMKFLKLKVLLRSTIFIKVSINTMVILIYCSLLSIKTWQ